MSAAKNCCAKINIYNPRIHKLIIDSLKNKNLSIMITNYNINHDVCKNTILYGQYQYTSYAIAETSTEYIDYSDDVDYVDAYFENRLHLLNLSKLIYNEVEMCMMNYPDYYINISTRNPNSLIEESHILHEPDYNMYLKIE